MFANSNEGKYKQITINAREKSDIALFFTMPENEMMKVKNIIYLLYDYILYSITLYMNKHGVVNKNPYIS